MNPVECPAGGRTAARIAAAIAAKYIDAGAPAQDFLPADRMLAVEYGVARSTVRRALGLLENQGTIRAEHGRGCRILRQGVETAARFCVAVLQGVRGRTWPEFVDTFREQCLARKWQVLNIDVKEATPEGVLRALADTHVHAVAMTIPRAEIACALQRAGIPCVAVEAGIQGLPVDQVNQDNYGAAQEAARHLLEKGHRRLAWIGPVRESHTAFARFSGARSTLAMQGLDFRPEDVLECGDEAAVRQFLARRDRPRAVLAMWHDRTVAVLRATAHLRMRAEDLDVVGWGTDRQQSEIGALARQARCRAAVLVWNLSEMAEVVASRIQLLRIEPGLRPLHIEIPSRLVTFGRADSGRAQRSRTTRGRDA
jgi:DNA-binding LacI/PurR family transcriptional regulator